VILRKIFLPCALAWLVWVAPAFSQFYAPDTEYHDLAQRCFVVEAARVLAARENKPKLTIESVSFEVTNKPNRETSWQIQWLAADSSVVKEVTVSYPESLLTEGPGFYRTVFDRIWNAKWRVPKTVTNLTAEFWRGANEGGLSRVESLEAAWKFEQTNPKEEQLAPHLAGLLQSAALPSSGGAVSLDALLLPRSAAWLCLAEKMSPDSQAFDACWAPTLLLAGRENAAAALWKEQRSKLALPVGAFSEGWDFLLGRPRAREAFVYAAAREHRPFTLPILAYYAEAAPMGPTVGNIMYPIFAADAASLARLYDYAPFLSIGSGVSGGRVMEGIFPALARAAWLKALQAQPLSALDYSEHTNLLKQTLLNVGAALKQPAEDMDASVTGLAVTSEILGESYREGVGPLIPTSVATARDLLNYGWESTCVQMEARHRFVSRIWGIPDLARTIIKSTAESVPGSSTAFLAFPNRPKDLVRQLRRIQFADGISFALRNAPTPVWGNDAAEDRLLYPKRCWLRTWHINHQIDGFIRTEQLPEIVPYVKRLHRESGPAGDANALQTLVNLPQQTGLKLPGKQKMQEELAAVLIEPSILQLNTAWNAKYEKMPYLQRGQELEKIFWDAPTIDIHSWIYHNYLYARAYTSVRRFYTQVAQLLDSPIGFANGIGQMHHMLGMMENDQAARTLALKSSASGSQGNMMMLIRDAVYRDDLKDLEAQITETMERYPNSAKALKRLNDFVPLIPALRDSKHADHANALDHFANDSSQWILQWLMIKKYNLTTNDAIRFLGGEKTDLTRQALIAYLARDKKKFDQITGQPSVAQSFTGASTMLMFCLDKDLLPTPEPEGQKDLKPANAETIEQAVINSLKRRR